MAFDARVLKVLIASPGDTAAARDAAERALRSWNSDRAEREQVILLPRRWELDAVPRLGGSGQSVINAQLVDDADIVIALFDSRLGMATAEAVSGTAEEVARANDAGKQVHVWFSDEPIPRDSDLEQLAALQEFRSDLEDRGLLGSYSSPDDLMFKVRQAVEQDLVHLDLGPVQTRPAQTTSARLRTQATMSESPRFDSKGRPSVSRSFRLFVRNVGDRDATDVKVELRPLQEGDQLPRLLDRVEGGVTIIPDSEVFWPLSMSAGTNRTFEVIMTWREDETERVQPQTVSA